MSKKLKVQSEKIEIKKPEDRYPVFCFKHLQPYSYPGCKDASFFIEFLERMKKLANLGWQGIRGAGRHGFGLEKIPIKQLRITNFPPIITEDVSELLVFRATGSNLPFLGLRMGDTFQVLFIETNFGEIYPH